MVHTQRTGKITHHIITSSFEEFRANSGLDPGVVPSCIQVAQRLSSRLPKVAKNKKTIGIGAGQTSRVDSSRIAIQKYHENLVDKDEKSGCVIASDAFFPFSDGLSAAIDFGVKAVIQPGGSIRDDDVIKTADKSNVAMVFTGFMHFKH